MKILSDEITLYYCKKHNEWWSQNCSNCMADNVKRDTHKATAEEIFEGLEKLSPTITIGQDCVDHIVDGPIGAYTYYPVIKFLDWQAFKNKYKE